MMSTTMKRFFKVGISRRDLGFTLLEVSIAVAIIAVVFVSLVSLFNASIGLSDYAKQLTRATFLAQKLMTEQELSGELGAGTGELIELEDEFKGFSYKVDVMETIFPMIQEVRLTVYFESVIKTHAVMLTSYIAPEIEEVIEEEPEAGEGGGE